MKERGSFTISEEQFDFGEEKSEVNVVRIDEIAKKYHKNPYKLRQDLETRGFKILKVKHNGTTAVNCVSVEAAKQIAKGFETADTVISLEKALKE